MKKILFFVVAIIFVNNVFAQDLQKNIFGIRAGVNFSKIDFGFGALENKISFNAGFSYEHLLKKDIPLYLETGLHYSNKGYQTKEEDREKETLSLNYLQIPLMLNYKFKVGKSYTIYPSAGVYYAYAISGNHQEIYCYDNCDEIYKYDAFDDEYGADVKRSDLGYRVGASAVWKKTVLSVGYEKSLINIGKDTDGLKVKNSNIFISLGLNF